MTAGKLPQWIQTKLSETDVQKIEDCVAEVESRTQGEVVPMIVARSIPREPFQVGFTLFLLLSVIFLIVHQYFPGPEDMHVELLELIGFTICAVVGFSLAQLEAVQKFFISSDELISRVYDKAELEFYRARVHKTQKGVGILLFLSLAEHRAVVLADKAIAEKLKPEDWLAVVHLMTRAAKENRLASGMCDAVRECGKVLSQHFPAKGKSQDEISNKLILRGD